METMGVLCGLGAALCHSFSYLFSRHFVVRRDQAVLRLLVASHVIMGVISLVLLPFVWSSEMPPVRAYALPLAGIALFYLAGQASLFYMIRETESSRVSPLLGFKIVILACIVVLFMDQHLARTQWLAVGLSVAATGILGYSGGGLSVRTFVGLILSCTAYSISDLSIAALVKALAPLSALHASIVGVCLSYILCGGVGLLFVPRVGAIRMVQDCRYAAPFALSWLMAMLCLFACFALVGPVYGNILQSTRGIMSVVLGAWVARAGFDRIEQKTTRMALLRRLGAAILMCLAIWLFQAGR